MATPCSDSGSPQWRNPVNRRNWISSKEVHRLCSSGSSAQSPTSPSDAARAAALQLSFEQIPPLVEVEHWYKKVACCHLESLNSGGGNGQGVIVCLDTDVHNQQLADILGISTYPAFALITCHHIITRRSSLKNWRLVVSGLEMKKFSDKLDSKKFEACKSCCGPDGVLGQEEHFNDVCPFGADFTVLVLTKEFANDLLKSRDLLIPTLMPLDMRSLKSALQSERFYIFKRDQSSGVVRAVELNVHKRAPPTEDEQSVEGEVNAYKEMCILRYDKNPEVLRGDSGAGIFLTKGSERLLLGIHKSTEAEDEVHTGIAIHAIFHAIASETEVDN